MARMREPIGKEIAEKAQKIKLDKRKSVHATKDGKSIKFAGADLTHIKALDEMEEGQVIGVLDTELKGDETDLPPGKYNLFVAKVNGDWHGYAESGGQIVTKAARVRIERHRLGESKVGASFASEGWCIRVCWVAFWGWCIVSSWFCF